VGLGKGYAAPGCVIRRALRERQVAAVFRVLGQTSVEAVLGKEWATGSFLKNRLNVGGRLDILPEAKSHMQRFADWKFSTCSLTGKSTKRKHFGEYNAAFQG
jgi:hypothetical protein